MTLNSGQRVVVAVEMAEQEQTVDPFDVHGERLLLQVGCCRWLHAQLAGGWFRFVFVWFGVGEGLEAVAVEWQAVETHGLINQWAQPRFRFDALCKFHCKHENWISRVAGSKCAVRGSIIVVSIRIVVV